MSRIGKQPITIPETVALNYDGGVVTAKSEKGELSQEINGNLDILIKDGICTLAVRDTKKTTRQKHGLYRQLISNMIEGLSKGFEKKLRLIGVGYRAELQENLVLFNLGYSMQIMYRIPPGISVEVEGQQDIVIVKGIDKQRVGQVAAEMRFLRKPEPYKGKGVRYYDEKIKLKQGKTGK